MSSITPSDGDTPRTFYAQDWSDPAPATPPVADSSSGTAEADTQAAEPAAPGATTPAADPATNGAGSDPQGPIPYDRHKAILDGQRADWDAKWQRVAGFDELVNQGLTAEQARNHIEWFRSIQQNPQEFVEELLTRAQQYPQLAPVVRTWAGRVLGSHGQNGQDAEPQPDAVTEDGRPGFTAARLREWQEWNRRQASADFDRRLAPIEQAERARAEQQTREAAERAQFEAQAREYHRLKAASPLFEQLWPKIEAHIRAKNGHVTLVDAFNHILLTEHLPNVGLTGKAQAVAEMKTLAAASSANPKAAVTSTAPRARSFYDPGLKWEPEP
jgi:hypothetical protein